MPRQWAKLRLGWRWFVGIALAALLCSFCSVAQANSAAPPTLTWFKFDHAEPVQPLEGLQVVQCSDLDCQFRVLLAETGDCRGEHCLARPESQPDQVQPRLDCRDDSLGRWGAQRCLAVSGYFADDSLFGGTEFFKLAAQFPDQHRESAVIALSESERLNNNAWQVEVLAGKLDVSRVEGVRASPRFPGFGVGFGLTVMSELLVAWVYGRRRSLAPVAQRRLLATLGLVHLVSYPTVWNFMTGFDYFQLPGTRAFSVVCFAIAMVWSGLLWLLRNKDLKVLLPGALVALMPLFFVGLIVTLFVGYGQQVPVADGLPRWLTVAIAETFAVVYEAVLLRWLNPKALSLRQAGLLSLAANGVSVVLGAIAWAGAVRWMI